MPLFYLLGMIYDLKRSMRQQFENVVSFRYDSLHSLTL